MISTRMSVGDEVVTGRCATQLTVAPSAAAVSATTAIVNGARRRGGTSDALVHDGEPLLFSSRTH